jgi:hypothetical protein
MNKDKANIVLKNSLVGGVLEGYGVIDQVEFIQIKNEEDYRIYIESSVEFENTRIVNSYSKTIVENIIIYNLKEIKDAFCDNKGRLTLSFVDDSKIIIGVEQKADKFFGQEPWQLSISGEETKLIVDPSSPEAEYIGFGEWESVK